MKNIIENLKITLIWLSYIALLKYLLSLDKVKVILENINIQLFIVFLSILSIISFSKKILEIKKYLISNIFAFLSIFINISFLIYLFFWLISLFYFFVLILILIIFNFFSFIIYSILFFTFIKLWLKCNVKKNNEQKKWFLASDKAIEYKNDDKLWIWEKAESFAKTIYNNWEKEWFIFWLVAPWWAWKTSFLNIFKSENDIKNNCIIFEFHPWYFESDSILLEKFLWEFKSAIINNTDIYLPELSNDLKLLLKILDKKTDDLIWLNLNFSWNKTLEETKNVINDSLKKVDKKIVIIIDDLDRISSEKLKTIFKIIDLCKWFYNANFVLCYDLQNFNNIDESLKITKTINQTIENNWEKQAGNENISVSSEEIDNTNLIKYIEKIVNVQYSIFPDFDKLKKYFYEIFTTWSFKFSKESEEWIKIWINKLFELESFRIWWNHISDMRSIKRIYNNLLTIVWNDNLRKNYLESIFDIKKWIYFDKFIELSILSLSYNNLFTDIYSESVLTLNSEYWIYSTNVNNNKYIITKNNWLDEKNTYTSSIMFKDYLKTLNCHYWDLLKNIFPLLEKWDRIEENGLYRDIRYWNNINKYLYIINLDFWDFSEIIVFENYIELKQEEFFKSNVNDNILKDIIPEINWNYPWNEKGELNWLEYFINILDKNLLNWENKKEKSIEFINYVIENFYKTSYNYDIDSIRVKIEQILNAWTTHDDDLNYLWDFMYWKLDFQWKWILEKLINDKWWINWLRIAVSLFYWLHDNRDRHYFWNYVKWISYNKFELNKPNYYYSAKIARSIFKLFKENYINKSINIFSEAEKNNNYRIVFIIYQLTNLIWYLDYNENNYDIDIYENQNNWIKIELNKYYFEKCFVWANIKYFIQFLITYIWWNIDWNYMFHSQKDVYWILENFDLNKIYEIFEKDLVKSFINNRNTDIDNYISNNQIILEYNLRDNLKITLSDINKILEKIRCDE